MMNVLISYYHSVNICLNAHSRVFTCNNSFAFIMQKHTQIGLPNLLGGGGGTSGKDPSFHLGDPRFQLVLRHHSHKSFIHPDVRNEPVLLNWSTLSFVCVDDKLHCGPKEARI